MSERSFTVRGTRYVRQDWETTVYAEDFDEAKQKAYDDVDSSDVYDSYIDDIEVDSVECDECGSEYSGDCSCGETDPSRENPEYGSGSSIHEFCGRHEGDWIVAADDYTANHFGEEPVKIIEIYDDEYDGDDEIKMRFRDQDGEVDSAWIRRAWQFKSAKPETEEEREARQKAREEEDERLRAHMREQMALQDLLRV